MKHTCLPGVAIPLNRVKVSILCWDDLKKIIPPIVAIPLNRVKVSIKLVQAYSHWTLPGVAIPLNRVKVSIFNYFKYNTYSGNFGRNPLKSGQGFNLVNGIRRY